MRTADSVGPLLERQAQLDQLAAAIDRAAQGTAVFVGVVAEAGAGKTRLIDEMQRLHADKATFLCGRAFQATATTPYSVWVDALEPHLREMPRRELLHVLGGGTDLPRLFSSCCHLVAHLPSAVRGDIGSEQTRIFGQMGAMLSRMSRDRALVLALDNLQWADASSIELLHALMTAVQGCRLLVVGLFRGDHLRVESPLNVCIDSLARLGFAARLSVPSLSVDATHAILARETGRDWPAGTVHQLHRLTQGNALFVHEFSRHAAASGRDEPLVWSCVEALPETIQALFSERLWELDDDCRRVLAFAAAFEAPIGYELLRAITGFTEERLLDAIDRLCALRFLSETVCGSSVVYGFHKPLVQATVYRGLGVARRQFLHRLIAAEVIRVGGFDAATCARHLMAGAATDNHAEALPYLLRASKDALAVFGNHEAIALLASALKVIGTQGRQRELRAEIHLDLGESNKRLGRFEEAVAAWTEALPEASPRLAAKLRRCIARTNWQAGREAEALRVLEDGIARLGQAESTEEAAFLRQEYALALARQGRLKEALEESSLALALTDEELHPEVVARIYVVICLAHGYRGDLRLAMRAIGKAIGLCEDLPYPGAAFLAHYTMAGLLRYEGDFAAFEQQCDACMRIAERMHSVALASWPLSIRIERYTFEGRLGEAIDCGERALALDRSIGQGAVLPRTHAFLAVAYRLAGNLVRAKRHLEESRRLVCALEKREMRVVAVQACCEAFVEFHEGSFEVALSLVTKLNLTQVQGDTPIAFYALHPHALPLAAEAAARLGRLDEARQWLAELHRLRKGTAWTCEGTILLVNALIKAAQDDLPGACDAIEAAISLLDASARPFEAARARVDLAEWLAVRGQVERAADELNAAGNGFSRIGAVREVAAVGQRLRKLGRRPHFGQQRKAAGQPISHRESEVVGCVAQGKSNKQIAAQLFISELTVETHIKNILRKLGLKSRVQVAAYAATRQLAQAQGGAQLLTFPERLARRA
jgi:DNA-binding CsgD family transcriptional regulator